MPRFKQVDVKAASEEAASGDVASGEAASGREASEGAASEREASGRTRATAPFRIGRLPFRGPDADVCVGVLGVLLLVCTLVPLLLISPYNHSYADDWHYGVWAHLALQETGNVGLALVTALEQVGKAWFEWQGTYSAIFLMAIEPSVFGEQFYVLAAPIVLATLIAGTLFFSRVALGELLGASTGTWVSVGCVAVAVQLLLQPSPVEGIFWYNSAVYYTTYHGAALALMACVLRIADPTRPKRPRGAIVGAVLLAAFVAGGNFVTALVAFEVLCALLVGLIVRGRRSAVAVLPAFAVMVVGLALSLVAPGNEVRQQTQFPGQGAGVWGTIWQSSLAAFQYLEQWSVGLVVLVALFCVPLALRVGERAAREGWRFRYPLAVAVASVALFATSFTPTFWAQGTVGPGRVQNCRLDLFVVLVVVNVFWACGWLCARRCQAADATDSPVPLRRALHAVSGARTPDAEASGASDSSAPLRRAPEPLSARNAALACGLAALVAVCVVGSMAANDDLAEDLSSVSAARSVASGQAEAYHEQVLSRLATIESSTEQSLKVPFYKNVPHVLLMGDIRDNMDNYINYRLAQWYGKDSIIGYYASEDVAAPVTGGGE